VIPATGNAPMLDPGVLPMAGISPRRLVQLIAVVALAWGMISFGRQLASASSAAGRAEQLQAATTQLGAEVSAMQDELTLIQEQRYIDQQARAYRLGTSGEIPFALAADAPPLPDDAPGSASVRLGAEHVTRSPVDSWLELLFGPTR
jgi:cell division protein FtsB